MKKTMKKLLSLALALVLCIGCLPVTASAAGTFERISGSNRYKTAFAAADSLKSALGVGKFENVVIASGTGFADALAGSYLAAVKKAPILLVNKDSVKDVASYVSSNLVSGGTVYLLGGSAAVPAEMEAALAGQNVKRLSGKNRYDTNLVILQEAGLSGSEILVCTGTNFADSLSASAVGKPILLVSTALTDEQKKLAASGSGKFVIIGGEGAVNANVANELKAYGTVERLSGKNRYETSVKVAERFFQTPGSAVLAYAENFPDGLCGGPLAYAKKAPLILTKSCNETAANTYVDGKGIRTGIVLGGTKLISDKSANIIFGNEPVTGHVYVTKTTNATCTQDGYSETVCENCGLVQKAGKIPATGHSYEVIEKVEATTEAEGYTKYSCKNCGHQYQEAIAKLPKPEEPTQPDEPTGNKYAREPSAKEKAVAEACIKYLKEYGAAMVHSGGLTNVAYYRANQLTEVFEHDINAMNEACTYYKYGEYVDATEHGFDASQSFYQGRCMEAICKTGIPGADPAQVEEVSDPDAIAKELVTAIYNSANHWAYVGDPANPYSGVGVALGADGVWYLSVIVSDVNYD